MFAAIRRLFDPRARLREALGKQDLPSFPAVQMKVLKSLRDPDTALSDIGRQLGADPGLSARVLRTVNSAAFGLGRKVSDPSHAAALLGRSELENLVLSMASVAMMPKKRIPGFAPARFWRTASRRAATARLLAERVSPRDRSLCFTAGLLQDMAVPMLAQARPDEYGPILIETGIGPGLPALERDVLGFDHAEAAGWLCTLWEFPAPLTDAITGHHTEDADCPLPVRIVAMIHEAADSEGLVDAISAETGLSTDSVTAVLAEGSEQGDAMARALKR